MKVKHFFNPTTVKIIITGVIGIVGWLAFVIMTVAYCDLYAGACPAWLEVLSLLYNWPGIIIRIREIRYMDIPGGFSRFLFFVLGAVWWYLLACIIVWFSLRKKVDNKRSLRNIAIGIIYVGAIIGSFLALRHYIIQRREIVLREEAYVEYASEIEECEASGHTAKISVDGRWKTSGFYCLYTYSDGGKACTDSSQCDGNCVADTETAQNSMTDKSGKFLYGTNIYGYMFPCGDYCNGTCQESVRDYNKDDLAIIDGAVRNNVHYIQ